jgi:hypothetical protein
VSSRIDWHTKEEASTHEVPREEGEGTREEKERSFQSVQAYGTSGERMESQDQLRASTGETDGGVGQTGHIGQTGGCRWSDR